MEIKTYTPTNHRVRMLIYGGSGVGKTMFGATAPKPLFLAVENGLLSLSDKNVQYVTIRNLQDMRDVLKALKDKSIKDTNGNVINYETIVIDSLTEVQQVVIQNVTGGRQPTMNEWGKFSDTMAEILKGFAALDMHIIFTCLESEKNAEDDDGKEYTRFQPELFGKLAEKAQAMMDFVGRYYMKTEVINDKPTAKRVLTFTYNPRYKAKDRSGKMPQFADPDFSKLMKEFAKINIGEGATVGNVDSSSEAVQLTFPPDPKDSICTKEQQSEIKEAWNHLMRVMPDKEGNMIPETKWDAYLGATMKKHCGVDTTTKLRKKQAEKFFVHILDEMKKYEVKKEETTDDRNVVNKETGEVTGPIDERTTEKQQGEISGYDVIAHLTRSQELDRMELKEVKAIAGGHEIKFPPKTTKQELMDAIMELEFPNAPKKS